MNGFPFCSFSKCRHKLLASRRFAFVKLRSCAETLRSRMHTPVPHHGAHRNLEPGHTRDQSLSIEFKLVFDFEALRVCVKMGLRTHPLHNYCRVMCFM